MEDGKVYRRDRGKALGVWEEERKLRRQQLGWCRIRWAIKGNSPQRCASSQVVALGAMWAQDYRLTNGSSLERSELDENFRAILTTFFCKFKIIP